MSEAGRTSGRAWLALGVAVCGLVVAGGGTTVAGAREPDPRRVFDVVGGRPTSIVVTRSIDSPGELGDASEMLRTLSGVIGTVSARDWTRLRSMVRTGRRPESMADAELVGVMHLRNAGTTKRVEILRLGDGVLVASEVDPFEPGGDGAAAVLPEEFGQIAAGWARYRGGFGQVETPLARSVDMAHPYRAGWVTFDEETLGDRFLAGGRTNLRAAARDLDAETLWVRLPAGYTPRNPAGMLVWIDPTDSGQPPACMHSAADALNFVIVGASLAGNDRYIADRHQLEFDAMATAMERYHIDPTRVYATGVSGGGRVATMYWACFSDVFAGAIPIVGTSAYENVPMGNGRYMARGFLLPRGVAGALRKQRLGAMTGPPDFNYAEIARTVRMFDDDGYAARLFEYPDMAHEYPTAERFRTVLEWVDEPWRVVREEAEARARSMMEGYRRRRDGAPTNATERELLVRITEEAPWSEAAWEAAELLGLGVGEVGERPALAPTREVAPGADPG